MHCRERVYTEKAGDEKVVQHVLLKNIFHGFYGYQFVLANFINGIGPRGFPFGKFPSQNNREGNEEGMMYKCLCRRHSLAATKVADTFMRNEYLDEFDTTNLCITSHVEGGNYFLHERDSIREALLPIVVRKIQS